MRYLIRSEHTTTAVYTAVYCAVMSYGLNLVQAQGSQIMPYIAWAQNPEFFNNDLMGITFSYYESFSLWFLIAGWMGKVMSPFGVVQVYFIIQCVFEVFALRFFAKKLFPGKPPVYHWTVIVLFTFGGVLRYSLGSVAPFGWTVFPDTLATSMLLFSLGYLLEKKFIPAALVSVITLNVHLGIASFMLCVIGLLYVLNFQRYTPMQIAKTGVAAVILVLPLAVIMFSNPSMPFVLPHDEWIDIYKIHQGMHAFPTRFGLIQYLPFIFWVVLFSVAIRYLHSFEKRRILLQFWLSTIIVFVIAFIFIEIFENRFAVTLSYFRGSRFLTISAVCCVVAFITDKELLTLRFRKALRSIGVVAVGVFILLNIIIYHPAYRLFPEFSKNYIKKLEQEKHSLTNTLFFQTIKFDREYSTAWRDVQLWCRDNTPIDTVLLTPFHIRGFRSFSKRNIFFQYRDVPLMTYYYMVYDELMKRVGMIDISIKDHPTPTAFQLFMKDIYQNYTAEDVKKLAVELPIQYIVTEHNHTLDLPEIYSNSHFTVYKLTEN